MLASIVRIARAADLGGRVVGLAVIAGARRAPRGRDAGDRLERFRELVQPASRRAGAAGAEAARRALGEMYALLDDEIVESLRSGGPFASRGVPSGAPRRVRRGLGRGALRVHRVERRGRRAGAHARRCSASPACASRDAARVRGRRRDRSGPALLGEVTARPPEVYPWPARPRRRRALRGGWEGAPLGATGPPAARRALERRRATARRGVVWSSADSVPGRPVGGRSGTSGRRDRGALRAALSRVDAGLRGPDRAGGRLPRPRADRRARPGAAPRRSTAGTASCGAAAARALRGARGRRPARARRAGARRRAAAPAAGEPAWPSPPATRGCGQPGAPFVVAATAVRRRPARAVVAHLGRGPRGWRLTAAAPVLQ